MAPPGNLFLTTLILSLFCCALAMGSSSYHPKEVKVGAIDIEEAAEEGENNYILDGPTCHMEYQVVKRVVGTCVKLGRSARGCVAGNYLHPLHPECM